MLTMTRSEAYLARSTAGALTLYEIRFLFAKIGVMIPQRSLEEIRRIVEGISLRDNILLTMELCSVRAVVPLGTIYCKEEHILNVSRIRRALGIYLFPAY